MPPIRILFLSWLTLSAPMVTAQALSVADLGIPDILFCHPNRIILADADGRQFVAESYGRAWRPTSGAAVPTIRYRPRTEVSFWAGRVDGAYAFLNVRDEGWRVLARSDPNPPGHSVTWASPADVMRWREVAEDGSLRPWSVEVVDGPLAGVWTAHGCAG